MSTLNKIRWGIVGTGWMARRFAITLNALDEASIVAVCSQDRARAESFKAQFGIEKCYVDTADLVNDAELDVIYVATPHTLHFATAMLALNAGKPVLCEKPFAMNADQARAIAALAKAKQLFCMEAMWTRFLPLYRNLKNVIAEAGLGEPIALMAEFGRNVPFDPTGRFYNPALGGGALLDMGVYGISVAIHLFGPPEEIISQASIGSTGVDEQCSVVLRYPQGLATLTNSIRSELRNDLRLFCTHGGLRVAPLFIEANRLELWHLSTNTPPALPQIEPKSEAIRRPLKGLVKNLLAGVRNPPEVSPPEPFSTLEYPCLSNRHAYQALETMRCLREGLWESPILPLSESVQIMETMDRVRESWRPPQQRSG
ncbi:Gfo/Idh/MocA family protein [Methylomonas sp. MgM2]